MAFETSRPAPWAPQWGQVRCTSVKYTLRFDSGSFEVWVNLEAYGVAFWACRTFLGNNRIK
jgi:hypothetical protein